jgi:hypothetical protein
MAQLVKRARKVILARKVQKAKKEPQVLKVYLEKMVYRVLQEKEE